MTSPQTTSTVDSDRQVVIRVYEALSAGDVPALLGLTSPDVVVRQSDVLPWGGTHHGHQGFLTFLGSVQKHLDSTVELGTLHRAGDRIVQVGRTSGRARGTGRAFDAAEVQVWRIQDGLVAEFDNFADTDELLRAIVSESPAGAE